MKKRFIPIVALASLLTVGTFTTLVSCGGDSDEGGEKLPAGEHSVTYNESTDYEVSGLKESYKAGETVSFSIKLLNPLKLVSSVRANSTRLTATDGVYSFTMGEENVIIDIRTSDRVAPSFVLKYTGRAEEGQTLTLIGEVDGVVNSSITWSIVSGADKGTISGNSLTLTGAGSITVKGEVKVDVFDLSEELTITIAQSEASLGTNIAYHNYNVRTGGEGDSPANRGTWVCWTGDGGSKTTWQYNKTTGKYELGYATGWAWYSVQLFYTLPYSAQGDRYAVRFEIDTQAAGSITANGNVVELQNGNNLLSYEVTAGGNALISIQLGVEGSESFGGNFLSFSPIRIYDLDSTKQYHKTTFKVEEDVAKEIYVLDGKKTDAPSVTAPSGKILDGWYEGETLFNSNDAITAPHTYTAKFIEKSEDTVKTVSLNYNGSVIKEVDVATGSRLEVPELDLGFGHKLAGLYTDEALTIPYDTNATVDSNITLYVKSNIRFDVTYTYPTGKIEESAMTNSSDGSLTLTYRGQAADSWHVQANFTNGIIIGSAGESYEVTFTYDMSVGGAGYQLYDGNSIASGQLESGTGKSATITYDGGVLNADGDLKVTFEFGALSPDEDFVFTIHSISLTKK